MSELFYSELYRHFLEGDVARFVEDRHMYGSAHRAAIVRLASLGVIEKKPFDLSGLAYTLHISRQQVMRRVEELEQLGILHQERVRNRILVLPTQKLVDWVNKCGARAQKRRLAHWSEYVALARQFPSLLIEANDNSGKIEPLIAPESMLAGAAPVNFVNHVE